MSETTNTIIREHGDKLDVSIGGKFQTVPKCTCGKCIVRRLRENVFTPFPYAKDLASTYKDDYDWKTNQKEGPEYNRSKHNSFEGAYKEHIPTSLISTAKMSYKPFKVREKKKNKYQKRHLIKYHLLVNQHIIDIILIGVLLNHKEKKSHLLKILMYL